MNLTDSLASSSSFCHLLGSNYTFWIIHTLRQDVASFLPPSAILPVTNDGISSADAQKAARHLMTADCSIFGRRVYGAADLIVGENGTMISCMKQ